MGANLNLNYLVNVIIAILVSLVVHEFMHAYTGYKLGDTTAKDEGRLSFNPLSHIDPIMTIVLPIITLITFGAPVLAAKPVPYDQDNVRFGEFGGALIAVAGPLSNLVLAVLAVLVINHFALGSAIAGFLTVFVTLNVALFVFNLIPIPPLDGSRVLYAFAPESIQEIMRNFEPIGLFVIFGLILFGGFTSILVNINQAILQFLSAL